MFKKTANTEEIKKYNKYTFYLWHKNLFFSLINSKRARCFMCILKKV